MYSPFEYAVDAEKEYREYLERQAQEEQRRREARQKYLEQQRQREQLLLENRRQESLVRQAERERKQAEYLQREAARQQRQAQRAAMAAANPHFEGGVYEFRKIILGWSLAEIQIPLVAATQQPPLAKHYSYANPQDVANYYQRFLPLILEEARTVLNSGLVQVQEKNITAVDFRLRQFKPAKSSGNPASFYLEGRLSDDVDYGTSAIAMLLEDHAGNKFIALVDIQDNQQLQAKAIIPNHIDMNTVSNLSGYVLGSLITYMRMYDVCKSQPNFSFLSQVMQGQLAPLQSYYPKLPLKDTLNDSQKIAIESFMAAPPSLQLLQGPPGTGKTTTIIELLKVLLEKKQRVLVCTPSNKAVQVIAKRAMKLIPDYPLILAGVEAKVDEALLPIFLSGWGKNVVKQLKQFKNEFELYAINEKDLSKESVLNAKDIVDKIKRYKIEIEHIEALSLELVELIDSMENDSSVDVVYLLQCLEEVISEIHALDSTKLETKTNALEELLLDNAGIVFCTLSVCGRQQLQNMKSIDVLIVDEAGQAVEAETLIPFSLNPKKCLLVGDTKQLPATVLSQHAKEKNFHWSMLWRLLEECKQPYNMLTVQYRMHPEIRRWPSQQYYENRLNDAVNVVSYTKLGLTARNGIELEPYTFIHVNGSEQFSQQSYVNKGEADIIKSLLDFIYYKKKTALPVIGIITFYAAQMRHIQNTIANKPYAKQVRVHTVDGFQGDECDVIIISCVRSNRTNRVGFLDDFRRLNVAVTRAKQALMVVGNMETLAESNSKDLQCLVNDATQRNRILEGSDVLSAISKPVQPIPRGYTQPQSIGRSQGKLEEEDSMVVSKPVNQKLLGHVYRRTTENSPVLAQGKQEKDVSEISVTGAMQRASLNNSGARADKPYNYKTQLCTFYANSKTCRLGDKCNFAHGEQDLRGMGKKSSVQK